MKRSRFLVAAVSIAAAGSITSCASEPSAPDSNELPVLERLTTDTRYTPTQRCLSTFEYDSIEVLDDRHLLFSNAAGTKAWINMLRNRCAALGRNATLSFEMRGNRVCSLDTARVLARFVYGNQIGPTCSLGEFEEVTAAQVEVIRRAL